MSGREDPLWTDEQRAAIECAIEDICVTAGAGSGKTGVLSERLAHALGGANPTASAESVVAVTFTKKAAAELAERVATALRARGLHREARALDSGWISTLHSLCARLLRAHPLDAGVDPTFSVISGARAAALQTAAFDAAASRLLAAGEASVARWFRDDGYVALRKTTLAAYERLRSLGGRAQDLALPKAAGAEDTVARFIETATRASAEIEGLADGATTRDNLARARASREAAERLLAADLPTEEAVRLLHEAVLEFRLIRRGSSAAVAEQVAGARDRLLEEASAEAAALAAEGILALMNEYDLEYSRVKARLGVVDFADLELRTAALLTAHPEVRDGYRSRFDLVMIDEFQDTNEVQAEIVRAISEGNLCVVGDERQSIYGFRNADLEVFRAHSRDLAEGGGKHMSLASNFRSHPDILRFVNATFGTKALLGESFEPLRAGRTQYRCVDPPDGRVTFAMVSADRLSEARKAEAALVASRLRRLRGEFALEQMAVLLRTRTAANVYASALRGAGLDCVIVGEGDHLSRPAVLSLVGLLRLVANRYDDLAALTFLGGPAGGLDAGELLRVRRAANDGPVAEGLIRVAADEDSSGAIAAAAMALVRARENAGLEALSITVLRAMEDLGMRERLCAEGSEGASCYADLRGLVRMADEYEEACGRSLVGFMEHVRLCEEHGEEEAPAPQARSRGAVQIMTMHAAKGLEFPVVAIADLGYEPSASPGRVLLDRSDGKIAMAVVPAFLRGTVEERSSARFKRMRAARERKESDEDARLLYVACTRAEEVLLLSAAMGAKCERSMARRLDLAIREAADKGGTAPVEVMRLSAEKALALAGAESAQSAGGAAGEETPVDAPGAIPERAAAPDRPIAPPGRVSYSDLAAHQQCPRRYLLERVWRIGTCEETADDISPMRLGTAIHAAMRVALAERACPSRERLEGIARCHGLSSSAAPELRSAVTAFTDSELGARALASKCILTEVPVAVRTESALFVGTIDLLAWEGDRALVVDHKSGEMAEDGADRRLLQAECYAWPLLRGGASVVDVVFASVAGGEASGPRTEAYTFTCAERGRIEARLTASIEAVCAERAFDPTPSREVCSGCAAAPGVCTSAEVTLRGRSGEAGRRRR